LSIAQPLHAVEILFAKRTGMLHTQDEKGIRNRLKRCWYCPCWYPLGHMQDGKRHKQAQAYCAAVSHAIVCLHPDSH